VHQANREEVHLFNRDEVHLISKEEAHSAKEEEGNRDVRIIKEETANSETSRVFNVLSVASMGTLQEIAEAGEEASKANDRTTTIFRGRLPKTTIFFRDTVPSVGSMVTTDGIAGKQHLTVEMWRRLTSVTLSHQYL
jgi:hypothetical protein